MPAQVSLSVPFTVTLELLNTSAKSRTLEIRSAASAVLSPDGLSCQRLDPIAPGGVVHLPLRFVAFEVGVCSICGLSLRDLDTEEIMQLPTLAEVLVAVGEAEGGEATQNGAAGEMGQRSEGHQGPV